MLITHVSTLLRWDVKWFNFCQPTLLVQQRGLTKVEPSDIPSQQCGNVCDEHDHTKFVFWFLSNISAQQINVCVCDDLHRN